MAIANWRNHQVPNRRIGRRQCLRHTALVSAIGDIEFCSDLLMCQLNQAIATWRLTQNGLQFLPVIGAIAKLQLIYRPLVMILPIACSQNTPD